MKITMILQTLNSIGICLCLCILILDLVNANATITPTNSRLAVELTLVERASLTGAYCLDGSLPAYRFHPGFGSGANNWLLQFEGGGWCNTIQSCIERTKTHRGSSWLIPKYGTFFGILSNNSDENPDFYNWNRVKLMYCDGASFAGDVDHQVSGLYFRGQRIWKAIIDDLLEKGLDKAKKALLSGCSAGGLSVFLHCDNFRQRLPPQTAVKCLSDAGFFLDSRDISGSYHIRSFYNDIVTLQNVTQNLQKECIASQPSPSKCFFPQYMLPYIQTSFFVLNSAYDTWQIHNILAPPSTDPHRTWQDCAQRVESCDSLQLATERAYRAQMLHALAPLQQSNTGGLFINSCFIHCQSETTNTWFAPPSTMINNKTIAKVVGDWYFDRDAAKEIDCPYPCDKTCYNQPQVPGGIYSRELWN